MKKKPLTKYSNVCAVPKSLNEDLMSIGFSRINLDKAVKFISLLKKSSNKLSGTPCCEVELPQKYLVTFLSSRYLQIINPLLEKGIICRNDKYLAGGGLSKRYNISSKYFLDSNQICQNNHYIINSNSSTNSSTNSGIIRDTRDSVFLSYMCVRYLKSTEEEKVTSDVKNYIGKLKIDHEKLEKRASELVEDINESRLVLDEQISDTHFEVRRMKGVSIIRHWIKLDSALALAKFEGVSLIKDDGMFYIMNKDVYLTIKRNWKFLSDKEAIQKLRKGIFTASRNDTNLRLDSNITNMSSELLSIILEDNDLIQIDLANSQFAILANLLPDNLISTETKSFIEKAKSGLFYEFIQDKLRLDSRKEAKQVTFEVLFSSHKRITPRTLGLIQELPELMGFINEFKEENGSNQFAIWLQKYEANIFIDGVLKDLYKNRIFALSKHDSIICKRDDAVKVLSVIEKVFSKNKFEGKLVY